MRRISIIFSAIALLAASCQKVQEGVGPVAGTEDGGYRFALNVTNDGFGPGTKADATVGWSSGEKVFVFFQPQGGNLISDGYLTLTYDGSAWSQSSSLTGGALGTSGKMSAVYVPYFEGEPSYSDGSWSVDGGDVYYACASGASYTVENGEVGGTLAMSIPDGYVQFAVKATTAEDGDILACNIYDAYTGVILGSDLAFSSTAVDGKKMTGHKDGDYVYFWGMRNSTSATDCEWTLTTASGDIVKTVPADKVAKNLAYTLSFMDYTFSLSDESDEVQTFFNYDETSTVSIELISEKADDVIGTASDVSWTIKSVQVGTATPQTVNDGSFENIEGVSAEVKPGNIIDVSTSTRSPFVPATHEYWVGEHGDWSPASWSGRGVIDLSKFDFQNETTDNPMSTANCYIIRHAGTYKLPLVYGNAMKNGSENYCSYYPNYYGDVTDGDESTDDNLRLVHFENHLGQAITSAFIENNQTEIPDTYICADAAAVLWQDQAEVVKDLQIVGDPKTDGTYTKDDVRYLQFTISQEDICQDNAIICIFQDDDEDGVRDDGEKIIWSWHIWVTNDPALISDPIKVTEYYHDDEFYFFPLTFLGRIDGNRCNGRKDVKIVLVQEESGKELEITVKQPERFWIDKGTYYQFGRKDPMCSVDEPYQGSYSAVSGPVSLADAICNPDKFYKVSSKIDWCDTHYFNLWTGKFSRSTSNLRESDLTSVYLSAMNKTVYDPSPVGYKVPPVKAYYGFSKSGSNSGLANGVRSGATWYLYTCKADDVTSSTPFILFPFTRQRACLTGKLSNPNAGYGYYWASDSTGETNGHMLCLGQGTNGAQPEQISPKSTGNVVRPVKE